MHENISKINVSNSAKEILRSIFLQGFPTFYAYESLGKATLFIIIPLAGETSDYGENHGRAPWVT